MTEWAIRNRLAKLSTEGGFFRLLALDHGLTFGSLPHLPHQARIEVLCASGAFTGVVLNPGLLRRLPPGGVPAVVLQTTSGTSEAPAKRPTWTAETAVRAGADAIALDLLLGVEPDIASQSICNAGALIESAHLFGMPALAMVRGFTKGQRANPITASIRTAIELGADLIKIGVHDLSDLADEEEFGLSDTLRQSPPVLLAGGAVSNQPLGALITEAAALGFRGFCVGRQIFADDDPVPFAWSLDMEARDQ